MSNKNRRDSQATPKRDAADGNAVGSLAKAIDVLEMITASSPPPSAAHITDELKLPRPTINRIIANLVRLGLLKRDVRQRQLVEGDRLLALALNVLSGAAQRGPRHQILRELASKMHETCNVGTIVAGQVRYVDRVESAWPLSLRLEPGSAVPLHCTAIGKLLLGHMPAPQRDRYLNTASLEPFTASTIIDVDRLRAELDQIARQGYALDREEYLDGVVGLAVPIPGKGEYPVLALAVAAPRARVAADDLVCDLPHLQEAALKLANCY
ncbi:MAG: IclR family transcriptional regulator [Lautropia sp.]|nr:IclR family transcriptional regulator [Lautropia sp.]